MLNKLQRISREYGALLAFVILAIFGGIAIDRSASNQTKTIYQSQLRSCQRGNTFRQDLNQRLSNIEVERGAFLQLLLAASAARQATYEVSHLPSDLAAAVEYRRLAKEVTDHVIFVKFPLVNCAKAYPKP